jgi:pseudaminic acid biosynthesis-associated methylase
VEYFNMTSDAAKSDDAKRYETEQEEFWAGDFGNEYIDRNKSGQLLTAKTILFGRILRSAPQIKSILEFGCNIGLNLQALHDVNNEFKLSGYEINELAAQTARNRKIADIVCGTIIEPIASAEKFDLTLTAGVLIHINPDALDQVYRNLVELSNRYVMVCEYYNPSPVAISYRGHKDRLFKRDFAGELIDKFGLKLIDYGFAYHRDNYFPQDDLTWFLLEK